jgi:hypothetical protein
VSTALPFQPTIAALTVCLHVHQGEELRHVLRVVCSCQTPDQVLVSLLHDSVEAGYPFEILAGSAYFPNHLLASLEAITRRPGELYSPDYLRRVKADELATEVKLLDIKDHLEHRDTLKPSLAVRYVKARTFLTS